MSNEDGSTPVESEQLLTLTIQRRGDVIVCGAQARRAARLAGFEDRRAEAAAIIAQELASNISKYAPGGTVSIATLNAPRAGLELRAEDRGPGIVDPEAALRDGHSQPPSQGVRPSGGAGTKRSLGVGLGAVQRLADEVTIENLPQGGVRVVARLRPARRRKGRR